MENNRLKNKNTISERNNYYWFALPVIILLLIFLFYFTYFNNRIMGEIDNSQNPPLRRMNAMTEEQINKILKENESNLNKK
jgi:dolichol kinase